MILTLHPDQVLKLTWRAVLVKIQDERCWGLKAREVWLPKSQILMTVGTEAVRIFVPEWLVKARGL